MNTKDECPKCGWRGLTVRYIAQEVYMNMTVPEKLIKKCNRCEYRWEEKPKDAK